jgi:hypothetical protein
MFKKFAIVVLGIGASACTRSDKAQTERDLHKTGEVVKKELKNDAAFVKQEALKAREETQKGVKKLKRDINEDKAAHRDDTSPPPDNSQQ